ncbi:MAG: TonB-dependent receptor [Gammaproteobacteria bacterium]
MRGDFVSLAAGTAVALLLSVVSPVASAQASSQPTTQIDFPAQPLATALQALARQTNLNILVDPRLIENRQAPALKAELPVLEALQALLSGTGLTPKFVDEKTITLVRTGKPTAEATRTPSVELSEVVITGSRMKRVGDGAQPVQTFTREDIDNSGQSTVATFLSTISQVSTSTGENTAQLGNGQTTVQLRGLPAGSTLVLLNGRRVESAGASYGSGGFFDLNFIPAGLVERIDVLPDSASAIYGSDALAGVINVILKKDFDGAEANLRYGFADGLDERSASLAFGRKWERGSASIVGTYFDRPDRLAGNERAITADKDYRRFGGPDTRRSTCNPGNVSSADGAKLPGLNSTVAAVPASVTGTATIADFVATAGQVNLCSDLAKYVVVPETTRAGAIASGHYALTQSADLFSEVMFTNTELSSANNNRSLSNVLVPASNAYNPFGKAVRVNYLFDNLDKQHVNITHALFARALLGARGSFAGKWEWELTASQARDRNRLEAPIGTVNTANLNAALASGDPATALNPFTAGSPASDAVLASLYSPSRGDFDSRLLDFSGFVRGSAFSLPAGDVQVVVGGERTREHFETHWSTVIADADRSASSGFAELRVPVIASAKAVAGTEMLALTGAVRVDRYSDFGSQASPQAGIEWRPRDNWLFRGSYGEAFRAPGLYVLYGNSGTPYETPIVDPARGGESRNVTVTSGANADLQPELGKTHSAGFSWRSHQLPLNLGASYWEVTQTNRVSLLLPQAIVNNEASFPDRVQRAPGVGGVPGPISVVDRRYLNVGDINVAGVDATLDYVLGSSFGEWTPRVAVTYTGKYESRLTPTAAPTDQVSRASTLAWAPRWKGALSLGWRQGAYAASASGRYVSQYLDYQDWGPNTRKIGNFWLVDLSARVEIGEALNLRNSAFSKAYASVAVANAFNSLPAWSWFSFSALGYDPSQYDIIGRMVQLNVGVRW